MLKIYKKILILIGFFLLVFSTSSFAVANIKTYTIKTEERNISSEKLLNSTIQYSMPSPVYDFFDENNIYNVVYTSEENLYWAKFDENMNVTKTVKIKQYYDKSNTDEFLRDIVFNFGNAIYYKGNLIVVYGREGDTPDASSMIENKYCTMAVVKYDKEGNIVDKIEMEAIKNNSTTDWTYGTYLPFSTNCNCSLTINDGILACFFGKQMINNHQSCSVFFLDADTLDWVSNRYDASEEDKEKYKNVISYYNAHSFAQRIIPTSDGGFFMIDSGDATYRGLLATKIYKDSNSNFQRKTFKTVHYREGGAGSYGYNSTYSLVGNVIELSDGYMYIGALENTLSRAYGNNINESWNIMIQKYSKDFENAEKVQDVQMFNTEVRTATGEPAEYNGYGRLYLNGTEKDYGIKWLTDLKNEKTVVQLRAVELENDQIAILYELLDLKTSSVGGYTYKSSDGDVYYMIIDKDGNIITSPTIIPGVDLTQEEIYPYKDGKIYWTSTENGSNEIVINVLDVKNPKLPFTDVKEDDWFYSSVKYVYNRGIILGTSDTTFNPRTKLTRGMLVTILHRMEGKPTPTTENKFNDVYKALYYYDAIRWATEKGIVHGYDDGSGNFGPDDNVTRQDLAVILRNYAQYKGKNVNVTTDLSSFSDSNLISNYAKTAMQWAVGKGVITGNDTPNGRTLTPHANSQRAEAAAMIYNYCTKVKDEK